MKKAKARSWLLRNDMITLYSVLFPLLGAGVVFFNRHQLTQAEQWSHSFFIIVMSIIWSGKLLPNRWFYQVPLILFIFTVIGVLLWFNERAVQSNHHE